LWLSRSTYKYPSSGGFRHMGKNVAYLTNLFTCLAKILENSLIQG
jgi:hypothetical protein